MRRGVAAFEISVERRMPLQVRDHSVREMSRRVPHIIHFPFSFVYFFLIIYFSFYLKVLTIYLIRPELWLSAQF